MPKSSVIENKAFESTTSNIGFNLVPQTNTFNSVFDTKPLDLDDASRLEKLLRDALNPGSRTHQQVSEDLISLKQITAEIKAIGKQGTILMGERVHRARELLKPYRDGTFSKWLESAFGTRRTGYNVLAYYELYAALTQESHREYFKKLQQRTAYLLASRVGAIETKIEIINDYHDRTHDELAILIRKKLPTDSSDKRVRRVPTEKIIDSLRENIQQLREREESLATYEIQEIIKLNKTLSSLLSKCAIVAHS
jgi:hypothetical protein